MMKILGEIKKGLKRWDAVIAVIIVRLIATGLQLLSKVILSQGTFVFAFMAYRHVVATLCIAPFALLWERDTMKKVTWTVLFWLSLVSLTGVIMAMGLFYYGIRDTSATYATNMLNLIPIMTFVLSVLLRMEKLRLQTGPGKAKIIGTMLCLAGALTVTLYKGNAFYIGHHNKHHDSNNQTHQIRGTLILLCSCLSYGVWFIIQTKVSKIFPYKYSATFIICMIATVQSALVGACIDTRKASWKLGLNLQLITVFYSGALATAATICLVSFAIGKKGPTYPSLFNPLTLILVAILEGAFLGQEITTGSLIGTFVILVGLFSFIRAQNKELKQMQSEVREMRPNNAVAPPPSENEGLQHTSMEIATLVQESSRFQSSGGLVTSIENLTMKNNMKHISV